jgi:hypothetical protein
MYMSALSFQTRLKKNKITYPSTIAQLGRSDGHLAAASVLASAPPGHVMHLDGAGVGEAPGVTI